MQMQSKIRIALQGCQSRYCLQKLGNDTLKPKNEFFFGFKVSQGECGLH
jgi:glycine cleavage system aminomethyltransferase T